MAYGSSYMRGGGGIQRRPQIQPEYEVDYSKIFRDALGTYAQLSGIERQNAQEAEEEEVRALMARAQLDPQAMAELSTRSPEAANQIRRGRQIERQGVRREEQADRETQERIATERAMLSFKMKGKNQAQQTDILDRHADSLSKRGLENEDTVELANWLKSDDPKLHQKARAEIEDAYQTGVFMGVIKPEKKRVPLAIERESEILNDPNADPEMKAAIRSKWAGSKQSIEYTPDGGFKMVSGRGVTPGVLAKPVVGALQKKQAQNMRSLSNLNASRALMDEQYLTYQGRFKGFASELAEKAGMDIGADQRKALKDFSKFKARSTMGLSQFLNDLSGAAINEHEAKRLKSSYPNPEDSYSVFVGKYEAITDELKQRNRIYNQLVREGFKGNTSKEVTGRLVAGKDDSTESRFSDFIEGRDEIEISPEEEAQIYTTMKNEGYTF